jgi:polyhydroxyalkanoate synthesis regulator phasin
MNTKLSIALLTAMTLGLAACGDSDQAKTDAQTQTPASEPATSATDEGKNSMDVLKEKVDAAAQSAAEAGDQAASAAAAAAQALSEKGSEMVDRMSQKGSEMADAATSKAREMIASVQDYLAENDLNSAQGIMDKLSQIKDSLPEELKTEIEALQAKIASMRGGDSAG